MLCLPGVHKFGMPSVKSCELTRLLTLDNVAYGYTSVGYTRGMLCKGNGVQL